LANFFNGLLDATGCNDSPKGPLECLQGLNDYELVDSMSFRPRGVVDGDISDHPFLPDKPEIMFGNGDFNQVAAKREK